MVDLLVQSNICRYLEFKCVTKLLSYEPSKNDQLIEVPCSRSDIFNSKSISIVQKRMLMKFMSYCMDLEKQGSDLQGLLILSFTCFVYVSKNRTICVYLDSFEIHSLQCHSVPCLVLTSIIIIVYGIKTTFPYSHRIRREKVYWSVTKQRRRRRTTTFSNQFDCNVRIRRCRDWGVGRS